jgi:hypothetical protein
VLRAAVLLPWVAAVRLVWRLVRGVHTVLLPLLSLQRLRSSTRQ